MRKSLLITAFFISAVFTYAHSARAAEDIDGIFCDKMSDESVYDQYKFDSYKMLIPGSDGWIFRSESDLRNDFTLGREALDNLEDLSTAYKKRGMELVIL